MPNRHRKGLGKDGWHKDLLHIVKTDAFLETGKMIAYAGVSESSFEDMQKPGNNFKNVHPNKGSCAVDGLMG